MRPLILFSALLLLAPTTACRKSQETVLNGRIEAYLSDLGPRTGGRLVELKVREGQRVKAGELLARVQAEELDAAVLRDEAQLQGARAKQMEADRGTRIEEIAQGEARLKDAEAALTLAEANCTRAESLAADRVLSRSELDRLRTERDRAKAAVSLQGKALAELKAGLRQEQRLAVTADTRRAEAVLAGTRAQAGFTEIRAPFDGIVVHRLREEGAVLGAGQAVLTLARLDPQWVKCYLPQPLQPRIPLGTALTVRTPDGRSFPATLDEVASEPEYTPKMVETAEERVNLVYPARIQLRDGFAQGLLPGTAVEVRIPAAR